MGHSASRAGLSQFIARSVPYLPTLAFASILFYVTVFQPYSNGPPIRSDGRGYHVWTYALKKWDFSLCEFEAIGETVRTAIPGRCLDKWPPGVALLRFPVMAWFVDVGNHQSISAGEHWVSLVFGAVLTLAIYGIGLTVLRRFGLDALEAQAVLFALFFGTGLFHYGTYDSSFSHVYSAFGSAVLTWQWSRMAGRRGDVTGRWDPWLVGAVAFFMILFRNTNALILLFFGVLVARTGDTRRRQILTALVIGATAAETIQLSYNYYASGHFSLTSYLNESFVWDRPMFRSVLFSYERGLFTYYPIVLLVLALGLVRRPARMFTAALIGLVLVYAALYGFWHSWFLGGGFGHRGFVELVPWMIPAVGLALADVDDRAVRKPLLLVAGLMLFVPLQVMLGYWRGSFPFENVPEPVYWAHLFGSLAGIWAIAAGVGVFAVTETLQMMTARRNAPRLTTDSRPDRVGRAAGWRPYLVPSVVFALAFVIRVRGVSDHFWMLGDQIRDWAIALRPLQDLPLVGPPTHVGGYTIGPAFYWILWCIRVLVGPWFQNLPHAGGIGQAALQSAVDALFLSAVWRRTGSFWLAAAATTLVVTAPFDLALAAVIWNPVVGAILAKAAIALVLLRWHDGSLGRVAIVAAIAWSAVHAYTGAIFVALSVFVALVADACVRREWTTVWRRAAVVAAVVLALQIPYAMYQLATGFDRPALGAVIGSMTDVLRGGDRLRLAASASYVPEALAILEDLPRFAATGWILIGAGVFLAIRYRHDPVLLAVTVLPQIAAVTGYAFWLGDMQAYYYLSLMPSVVLTLLLAVAGVARRPIPAAFGVALALACALVVPRQLRAAETMFRMPTYRALVAGSRDIIKRKQPMREIDAQFELHPTSDPAFLYRILGGRLDPRAEWRAEILPDGRVKYDR